MPLVTANQFQLIPEISRLGTGFAQGQQMRSQFDQSKRAQVKDTQEQSEIRRTVINKAANDLAKIPEAQRAGAFAMLGDTMKESGIDISAFPTDDFSDATLQQVIAATGGAGVSKSGTKAFAPVVDPKTGKLGIPTVNPNTGETGFQEIPGAPLQETPGQEREAEIKTKQRLSDIDVAETTKKETIKQTAARTSKIKTELSERNRNAARSGRTLRQAMTIAQTASQGLKGSATLQLSRLIPGIDAGDEALLDSTLKELALEQLQNFKGPTTDFEFGITQAIAGDIGNSKEANIARIKSLDRNRWFNEKEFSQFNQHSKDGGDPDNFRFNFAEVIKTKKGPFSLRQIQDTAVQNTLTIEETIKRLNQ